MSKAKSILFYIMVITTIAISLYDIHITILTADTIHLNELNPIAKRIILLGKESRSYEGIAYLVTLKSLLLCIISAGAPVFHYLNDGRLKKVLFNVVFVYFIEHLIVLSVLLW